jgi:conjugal transfer pilus assembly protein TraB
MSTPNKPGIFKRINELPSGQRAAIYGGAGLIAIFVIGGMFADNTPTAKVSKDSNVSMKPIVGTNTATEDLAAKLEVQERQIKEQQSRLSQYEAGNKANATGETPWSDVQNLVTQIQELRTEVNSIKTSKATETTFALPSVGLDASLPDTKPKTATIPTDTTTATPTTIQVIGASASPKPKKTEAGKKDSVVGYLPSGSVFEGVLLTGLDASTAVAANKTPTPALFRIKTEAILPNFYTQDVRECFVLAGGYGNLSSERAEMRTQTLSCINDKGEVFESDIEGYLVGEDGKAGIRGRVVSKQGSVLAKSFMAGFASGLGNAFSPQSVNTLSLQPTTTQQYQYPGADQILGSGLGQGLNKSGSALAQFYISMAQQMFPVIEIDAMRKVSIVVIKGIQLKKVEKKS